MSKKWSFGFTIGYGLTVISVPLIMNRHVANHSSAFCALLDEIWGSKRSDRIKAYQDYLDSGFFNVAVFRPPFGAYDTYKGKDAIDHSMEILDEQRSKWAELKHRD